MSPAEIAKFIVAQTDALLLELSNKLAELESHSHGGAHDNTGLKPARPRILSAFYCLCVSTLRDNDPAAAAQHFNQFMTNVRAELKRLHPDWKGPYSFESTLRQGEGMYLRDAPNIPELVRSKPDYVFEEEWRLVQKTDDKLALFALKAKIQILESLRILTHNPAHVSLALVIHDSIAAAFVALTHVDPALIDARAE